jgi:hypothetical protein
MEADNSRRETTTAEKSTISGMPTTNGTTRNVGSTSSRRDLKSSREGINRRGENPRAKQNNSGMNTSAAAQETTGAAGDASNGRDTKLMDTSGEEGILTREETPGRLTAERSTKRKG